MTTWCPLHSWPVRVIYRLPCSLAAGHFHSSGRLIERSAPFHRVPGVTGGRCGRSLLDCLPACPAPPWQTADDASPVRDGHVGKERCSSIKKDIGSFFTPCLRISLSLCELYQDVSFRSPASHLASISQPDCELMFQAKGTGE